MHPNKMKPTLAWLKITSWVGGFCCDAKHYYGTLISFPNGEKVAHEMMCPLTEQEARWLNKRDRDRYGTVEACYKPGQMTTGFWDKPFLLEAAKTTYREKFPQALALVQGEPCDCGPLDILHSDWPEFNERGRSLVIHAESIGWWDRWNLDEMNQLTKRWEELLKEFGLANWGRRP